MDIFSYRILVLNQQRVKCEVRNSQNSVEVEIYNTFNFSSHENKISVFARKAREDNIHADEIKQLGELLFSTFFNDEALSTFLKFRSKTCQQGNLLRIELEIDETILPKIASLPWEFMYAPQLDGRGNFWLATDPNLSVVRRRSRIDSSTGFTLNQGQILIVEAVISSPDDLKPVPYKDIWRDLKNIEQNHPSLKFIDLVNPGTKRNIDTALLKKPHVFHILAHGNQGKGNKGRIYLVDVTGDSLPLSGPEFAELFVRYSPPIAILHVCESGAQNESDALSSVASQVVDKNVPVVIAMQYPISNARAREFMSKFYLCLSNGEPVEKALQEGRREISLGAAGYRSRDFATPILYLSSIYRGTEKTDNNRETNQQSTELVKIQIGKLLVSIEFQNQVVDALLECESVADPVARQQIIARLPKDIRFKIGVPNAGARVQVSNIVRICAGHMDGIESLLESVEYYERDTVQMQNVKKLLGLN